MKRRYRVVKRHWLVCQKWTDGRVTYAYVMSGTYYQFRTGYLSGMYDGMFTVTAARVFWRKPSVGRNTPQSWTMQVPAKLGRPGL